MGSIKVEEPAPALFAQSRFALVCSPNFPIDQAEKVARELRLHGGEVVTDQYDGENLPLEDLTNIICGSCDFPSYDAAADALIPVTKPQWVDASIAKSKPANVRQYSPDPRLFLSDVVVYCADLPEGDKDAIIGGVLAMGGMHSARLLATVTHVVALTMDSDLCRIITSKNLNVKIVLPHWFDDCLKLGRRIDESPYLLPNPEILGPVSNFLPKSADNECVRGAVDPDPSGEPLPPWRSSPRGPLKVFARKKVMLANDLGIGSYLKDILKGLIEESKGQVTETVHEADMFICKYRSGQDYQLASQAGKDVGNLAWLYSLITKNTWTSPMRRLLHYPVARNGLPGFQAFRISLSNYTGEARLYLENLIRAAGAECTRTLKQDNTHLITAHVMSEKCSAAQEWGVHIINHLWLEESYARWTMQSITNSRYTHFPRRTNLGEVVGQTRIDRHALEHHFFPAEESGELNADKQSKTRYKREATTTLFPTNGRANTPKTPSGRPKPAGIGGIDGVTPKTSEGVKRIGERDKTLGEAGELIIKGGKENQTPTTTSSRKSKEAAAARLHDIVSDIALYEKEKKRVGGVVYGGRRKNDSDRVSLDRKRPTPDESDSDSAAGMQTKRSRTAKTAPSMHLLVSGYKKWVGHSRIEDADKRQLRELGIIVTQEPSRATHLAAPSILRTHKFISAMAYAPSIISTDFIDRCLEEEELLDPDDFVLQDKENEKRFHISLAQSQKRAKQNGNKLFQGRTIYCLGHIHGGFETFRSIIEANGGRCHLFRGRPGTMVPSRRGDSETGVMDDDGQAEVFLISGPEKDQAWLWDKFLQMAEGSRMTPRVVRSDWLLGSAMAQQILPVGNHALRG